MEFIHWMEKYLLLAHLDIILREVFYLFVDLIETHAFIELYYNASEMIAPLIFRVSYPVAGADEPVPGEEEFYMAVFSIAGEVFEYTCDLYRRLAVYADGVTDGIDVPEQCCGEGCGEHNGGWVFKAIAGTFQHMQGEHLRELGLHEYAGTGDLFVTCCEEVGAFGRGNKGYLFEVFGVLGPQEFGHGDIDLSVRTGLAIPGLGVVYERQTAVVVVVVIVRELIPYPKSYEEGDGHSDGEAQDIDERVGSAFQEVAPGDLEIVL